LATEGLDPCKLLTDRELEERAHYNMRADTSPRKSRRPGEVPRRDVTIERLHLLENAADSDDLPTSRPGRAGAQRVGNRPSGQGLRAVPRAIALPMDLPPRRDGVRPDDRSFSRPPRAARIRVQRDDAEGRHRRGLG